MKLTYEIARKILAVVPSSIPASALNAAQLSLVDGLAVMLAAVPLEPSVQPFQEFARASGPGPSRLLSGGTTSPSLAALANGALSHALDFEDTFDKVGLHPNAVLIPALLALAEPEEHSLGDFLAAMAIGCDMTCRIGLALKGDPAERGWYHPPIIGAVGAAFGLAYFLKLDANVTVSAVSLTLAQFMLSDALKRSPASDLRAIRDGFAARAAVDAVQLARLGVKGTGDPLGEKGGLFDILTGNPPDIAPLKSAGRPYQGEDVTIKLWPCCRGTHSAIQLALDLVAEGFDPSRIASVAFTVQPPEDMLFEPTKDRQAPKTPIGAKFSIPYTFAHTLLHGAPDLNSFGERPRENPETLALARRVTLRGVVPDGPRTAKFCLQDGADFERSYPSSGTSTAKDWHVSDIARKVELCAEIAGIDAEKLLALPGLPRSVKIRDLIDHTVLSNADRNRWR